MLCEKCCEALGYRITMATCGYLHWENNSIQPWRTALNTDSRPYSWSRTCILDWTRWQRGEQHVQPLAIVQTHVIVQPLGGKCKGKIASKLTSYQARKRSSSEKRGQVQKKVFAWFPASVGVNDRRTWRSMWEARSKRNACLRRAALRTCRTTHQAHASWTLTPRQSVGCLRSKPRARASARASDVSGHIQLAVVWSPRKIIYPKA